MNGVGDSYRLALKPTVLVIDDNQVSQTYLTILLADRLNVLAASSAKEGLGLLWSEHDISVVLLDFMLPDMNGLEVLRKIRSNKKTTNIHVVVITDSNNNEWMLRSINMGIQGCFKRPFNAEVLNSRVVALAGDTRISNYQALRELWDNDFKQRMQSVGLLMQEVLDYIDNNFHKACSREDIAAHVGICPDYLGRIFKENCGLRAKEYIILCRLHLSRELLTKHPQMKIKNVAQYAGVQNVDYFYRLFKKKHGFTPNQYRKNFLASINNRH